MATKYNYDNIPFNFGTTVPAGFTVMASEPIDTRAFLPTWSNANKDLVNTWHVGMQLFVNNQTETSTDVYVNDPKVYVITGIPADAISQEINWSDISDAEEAGFVFMEIPVTAPGSEPVESVYRVKGTDSPTDLASVAENSAETLNTGYVYNVDSDFAIYNGVIYSESDAASISLESGDTSADIEHYKAGNNVVWVRYEEDDASYDSQNPYNGYWDAIGGTIYEMPVLNDGGYVSASVNVIYDSTSQVASLLGNSFISLSIAGLVESNNPSVSGSSQIVLTVDETNLVSGINTLVDDAMSSISHVASVSLANTSGSTSYLSFEANLSGSISGQTLELTPEINVSLDYSSLADSIGDSIVSNFVSKDNTFAIDADSVSSVISGSIITSVSVGPGDNYFVSLSVDASINEAELAEVVTQRTSVSTDSFNEAHDTDNDIITVSFNSTSGQMVIVEKIASYVQQKAAGALVWKSLCSTSTTNS